MRQQNYERLLRIFHESVVQVIQLCGSDPNKLMTFDDLQEQLKKLGCFGVIMAPILLQVIVAESNNDLDQMANELLNADSEQKRVQFANFSADSLETYRRRMCDIIDDAQRYGWL